MIRTDPTNGFDVKELEAYLQSGKEGKLRALYFVPFHHNPTGTSISDESARRLCELSTKHDFYIFSDEPYGMMSFAKNERPRTLKQFETSPRSKVIAMHTFSKIAAPGLRLGWLHASPELISKLAQDNVLDSGGGHAPFVSDIMYRLLLNGSLERIVSEVKTIYSARAQRLLSSLEATFGDHIVFHTPTGGYFVYIKFKDQRIDAQSFSSFLEQHKSVYRVNFLAGEQCRVRGAFGECDTSRTKSFFRLSWAFYESDELEEGVRRLWNAYCDFCSHM